MTDPVKGGGCPLALLALLALVVRAWLLMLAVAAVITVASWYQPVPDRDSSHDTTHTGTTAVAP